MYFNLRPSFKSWKALIHSSLTPTPEAAYYYWIINYIFWEIYFYKNIVNTIKTNKISFMFLFYNNKYLYIYIFLFIINFIKLLIILIFFDHDFFFFNQLFIFIIYQHYNKYYKFICDKYYLKFTFSTIKLLI